jgi:hypothetical protein
VATSIAAFNSLLNDTLIAGLEQNVGVFWPLKGSDETPVKYNEFQSEAHQFVPGLICKEAFIKTLKPQFYARQEAFASCLAS